MAHKYVLDTHALIWYLEGNRKLSANAKAVMDDLDNDLVLPIIALVEAAHIVECGRTSIPSVSDLLDGVFAAPHVELHELTWQVFEHSLTLMSVPEIHDRLIVSTAVYLQTIGHEASLVTKDGAITSAAVVDIVW
jgi:PIN domain nuclease of toxin-antitoxin system